MRYNFRQIQRSWTLHDELPGLLKISFRLKRQSCILVSKRKLGKIIPCLIARTENTASMPPLAPRLWPVKDLVELMVDKPGQ